MFKFKKIFILMMFLTFNGIFAIKEKTEQASLTVASVSSSVATANPTVNPNSNFNPNTVPSAVPTTGFNPNAVPTPAFNPNAQIGTSSVGVSTGSNSAQIGTSSVGVSIGSNSVPNTNFNPNAQAPANIVSTGASIISNATKINSTIATTPINSNSLKISDSNSTLANCFYDRADFMIGRLQASVSYYSNLCSLSGKVRVNRLITVAGIIFDIFVYNSYPNITVKAGFVDQVNSIDQYTEFKFSSDLAQLKAIYNSKGDTSGFYSTLWFAMSDELDQITKTNNYPIFFRANIWKLIQIQKTLNALQIKYSANLATCIDKDWDGIASISDLKEDQNKYKIFDPNGQTCRTPSSDFYFTNSLFDNGGIAFAFWGSENIIELRGKTASPLVGYINNVKIYEYNLIPVNFTIVHQLKVLDVI